MQEDDSLVTARAVLHQGLAAGPSAIYGAMPVVFIFQGLAGYATWIVIGSLYISIEATDAGVEIEDPLAGI